MVEESEATTRVLVPAGALGIGVRVGEIDAGLAMEPHAIAIDAGSTDSGPAYLATGLSKYSRQAVKRDLSILMDAQKNAGVPLLVGTCGTSGCDRALDWTIDVVREIARECGYRPRIATLRSEISKDVLKAKNEAGLVRPLPPNGALCEATIDRCQHIVALCGPEPYMAALENGADIVLGGRTTDTAVLAAAPLLRGAGPGPALHAAKIAECGGLCTANANSPGVMIAVGAERFTVQPLSERNRCTPETVFAHMLYENADPFHLVEPGGVLDVTQARYMAVDDRIVAVTGSRFEKRPYTMKLEGAGGGPFQTIMLVGIQDPNFLRDIDGVLSRMHAALTERVRQAMGDSAGVFDISLRPYGWNATSGLPPPPGSSPPPCEIGLMFVATAATQTLATQIAKTCNPAFFHFRAVEAREMPSYGFPFSPAEIERGETFAFHLNHVVATTDPFELVRTEWVGLD